MYRNIILSLLSIILLSSCNKYRFLLDLAGLPPMPDQHMDGISLKPVFSGSTPERDFLFWHYPHYHSSGWTPGEYPKRNRGPVSGKESFLY